MKSVFSYLNQNAYFQGIPSLGFSLKIDESSCPGVEFKASENCCDHIILNNGNAEVICNYRADEAHNAVVYGITVKNISNKRIRLHDVKSMDICMDNNDTDVYVHSFFGGNIEFYYPPDNFSEREIVMSPQQHFPREDWCPGYRLHSYGGRSSDWDLPIAFYENADKTCGFYLGVIWSGDWILDFSKKCDGQFRVYGGMMFLDMLLEPGEKVTLPEMLLGAYEGNSDAAGNAIRRYLRDNYLYKFTPEQRIPPISYDQFMGFRLNFNDEVLRRQITILNGLGIETFVLDAGWYENPDQEEFDFGVGNFTLVDHTRFPAGLKPFFEYLRGQGYKGGLWFEPERAAKDSDVARRFPKAMLSTTDGADSFVSNQLYLVNLADPEVMAYTKAYLSHYIETLNLTWIRFDVNLNPRFYWRDADSVGRRGETELAYVHALYELLEWLNDNYPNLVIEGCASGGQRMDLGTMKYSSTFWVNDQAYNVHLSRYLLTAGNRILPGNYLERAITPMLSDGEEISDYYFMSHFGGAIQIDDPVQNWSEQTRKRCKKHLDVYKKLRVYLNDDYYRIFPAPRSLNDNEAWEFINPDAQEGFIQVFRSQGLDADIIVKMKGLTADRYFLTDPYTEETEVYTKEQLQSGILFTLNNFESQVRLFKKL